MLDELKFVCKLMAGTLAALWGLEIVDTLVFHGLLDLFGIHPRSTFGLIGILASPLLHGDFYHLLSNTVGLLIFGTLVLLWGRKEFALVTASSVLIGGLGVWLIGETGTVHIGASGVIFGYFGYVLTRGWYERKLLSIIISVVIAFMFGSMLSGAIPGLAGCGISWEGHLFGLLGGVLVARRLRQSPATQGQ
ncbi:rhomboid family intramembrane serine protease [Enhygromyxa salina]|uniref:rhomboid family intramembrane serine protease n=1 Tax=Enhygromyxa salina TaxID=215803 RepID=UPI001C6263DA|nr:rhomboid family intramembrane serine protease [Enhygromyxa salina]